MKASHPFLWEDEYCYFEVTIINPGSERYVSQLSSDMLTCITLGYLLMCRIIAIGLVPENYDWVDEMPGWQPGYVLR